MQSGDHLQWQQSFLKTQEYLRNRISGEDCGRDLIEAWRHFYQTYEPIVRLLVAKNVSAGDLAEQCVEEAWLDILSGLPQLRSPQTFDSFQFWLTQLVRNTTARLQSVTTPKGVRPSHASEAGPATARPAGSNGRYVASANGVRQALAEGPGSHCDNDRLLHMLIIEEQSAEDVARALGSTAQQVVARQRQIMKKILSILIRLDIQAPN